MAQALDLADACNPVGAPSFAQFAMGGNANAGTRRKQNLCWQQRYPPDSNNQPLSGLTWTSGDTNIATLSTDDPPVITAVAPGNVTITAGGASSDVTVYEGPTLPTGTVIWSNPGNGSGVNKIMPSVPSISGVADVFALQNDGTVQAIRSDGSTAWTANTNGAANVIPDFQGGLTLASPSSLQKLDGMTGQAYQSYSVSDPNDTLSSPVIHTDSTVFSVYTSNSANNVYLVGVDPATGQEKFRAAMDQSRYTVTCSGDLCNYNASNSSSANVLSTPIVAGDGYAYVPYQYTIFNEADQDYSSSCDASAYPNAVSCTTASGTGVQNTATYLMLLRVGSDGSSSKIQVQKWNQAYQYSSVINYVKTCISIDGLYTCGSLGYSVSGSASGTGALPNLTVPPPITNADTGVLLSWEADMYCGYCGATGQSVPPTTVFGLATTSSSSASSTTVNIPSQAGPIIPILQAQDGSFFGTVGTGPQPGQITQANMIAFDSSGKVKWTVPNDVPQIATNDGGLIGTSGIRYDRSGNAVGHLANLPTYSWKGAYQVGSVHSIIADFDPSGMATTFASVASGNLTGNGFFLAHHSFGLVFCNTGPGGDGPCPSNIDITSMTFSYLPGVDIRSDNYTSACDFSRSQTCDSNQAHPDWISQIKIQALNTYLAAFSSLPAIVRGKYSPVMRYGGTDNPPFEHTIYVDGQWFSQGTGLTSNATYSWVFYLKLLQAAEEALGSPQSGTFTPPFSDTNGMSKLLKALGIGIGTAAAHETGWELGFSGHNLYPLHGMNCGPGGSRDCENNIDSVYESAGADGWKFLDWNPPITWEPSDKCNIERYLLNTNLSNRDCQ